MKQNKVQNIFYFLFLLACSFSLHANVVYSPAFHIGPGLTGEKFGEMSSPRPIDNDYCIPGVGRLKCPRPNLDDYNRINDDDRLEKDCAALQQGCIDDCLRMIKRNAPSGEIARRQRNCYANCNKSYQACLNG